MPLTWPQDMFRNALDHIPDAVLIADCAGAVRFANRQAPKLLGYTIEELMGQDLDRLTHGRSRRSHTARTQPLAAAGRGRRLAARRKDGSKFPAQISFGSIEAEQGTFIVATIRDITAYRRLCGDLSRARDAAAHAQLTARQALDALAATRHANALQWTTTCYVLRQQLHALSMINGLLARRGRPDEATLTHALSSHVEAIVNMINLLTPSNGRSKADAQSQLESHPVIEPTQTRDAAVARLVGNLSRNTSRLRALSAREPANHAVLIVIRDQGIREAAAALLRISGYEVLTVGNGEQAQAAARLHPQIDYVLTERALGDSQTGAALSDSLRSTLGATLKTILISDDPVVAPANGFDPDRPTRIARMPVRAEELLLMMEDMRHDETAGSEKASGPGE